ncbi:MAG: hypothetical protein AAF065_14945 [Verrucomicrobiota bacterium]
MQSLTKILTVSLAILGPLVTMAHQERVVDATQRAHGLEAWWGKEAMQVDAEMIFGGNKIVEGTFTFEAHGPRSRYDRADGVSIIFDGETAWVTPADAKAPMGRFHVLTWPWFVFTPFKMQGEGITLSGHARDEVDGVNYYTMKQTFGDDMGDAPDDWYRFFINPESLNIDAMSYIVTYGKDVEEANKKPSIIYYHDYVDADGPVISTRYEFWLWDAEKKVNVGDSPKGVGTISNITYPKLSKVDFTVPKDARELKLPGS